MPVAAPGKWDWEAESCTSCPPTGWIGRHRWSSRTWRSSASQHCRGIRRDIHSNCSHFSQNKNKQRLDLMMSSLDNNFQWLMGPAASLQSYQMLDFWHIWAVLNFFLVSVKRGYDKLSTDKTFQADMSHTDKSTPSTPTETGTSLSLELINRSWRLCLPRSYPVIVVSVSWISGMDRSKVLSESLCSGLALKHERHAELCRCNTEDIFDLYSE